ncbi:MAG: hypothetical protein LBJ01_10200 [Tannerella sp.]|jgi:hypothetical protein|nr:hypothetical protein [Tannerella sp.]
MTGFSKIIFPALLGGVLCSAHTAAQEDRPGAGWKDFDYIKQSDVRLAGDNAAGLRYLPVDRVSVAGIYANRSYGKFINYYQSDNSYTLGAQTESFYRFSPGIVFHGSVSYAGFTGKNMGGSAFINPYGNPFDIVEYSDTTRGIKNLETYHLTGAISADVSKRLTIGGKVDYTAANYAKRKDLRHKNKLLDMYVTAGLSYRINKALEIGANYYYRRSVEGVEFKIYGTTDKQYFSLINYGAFYGKTEMSGETGYTSENEDNPMYNSYNGASLQLGVHINPAIHIFNELAYKSRNGEFGKRDPRKIVYSEHNSGILEYRGSFSLKKGRNHHFLNINIENETLENFENVYRFESRPGGANYIVYYDPLKVADRERFGMKAEYVACLDVRDFCPEWIFRGGVNYNRRKLTASFYPYYRKQNIHYANCGASATRNIIKGKNMYGISLDARYASGGGTIGNDGLYAAPGENQIKPASMESGLQNEYEYLTTGQVKGNIGLKYSKLFDKPGIRGYAALDYSLTKAFGVKHLEGNSFNSATVTVGCVF